MSSILTLEDLKNFYSNIKLSPPTALQGGQTYTSRLYSYDHLLNKNPVYFYTVKCRSKNGVVVSDRKCYIDLVFDSTDDTISSGLEGLEKYLQSSVVENSSDWFENTITLDDVELSFLNSLRPYHSGKKLVLRCNVGTINTIDNVIRVYNEGGDDLTYKDITSETEIICIIHISSLRFTSKNFMIDYAIKQIMVLDDNDINSKKLIIDNRDKPVLPILNKQSDNNNLQPDTSSSNDTADTLNKTQEAIPELENVELVDVSYCSSNNADNQDTLDVVHEISGNDINAVKDPDHDDARGDNGEDNGEDNGDDDDDDEDDDEDYDEDYDDDDSVISIVDLDDNDIDVLLDNSSSSQENKLEGESEDADAVNTVTDGVIVDNVNGTINETTENVNETINETTENHINKDSNTVEQFNDLEVLDINELSKEEGILSVKNKQTTYNTLYEDVKRKAQEDHEKALKSFLEVNKIKTTIS